jgi:thioredoxin 1
MALIAVTEATFEQEVLQSQLPVLVDLYADWCAPCKQIAPVLQQMSVELQGKLKIVQVDVDKNRGLAQAFRAQSIPMLVLIQQGQVVNQHVGMADKKTLMHLVEPVLPKDPSEIKPHDLAKLLAAGRVLPVDVRDASSYARYRIPGAIHIPHDLLLQRVQELHPRDGRIRVLYGRSTDEAKDLVEQVRHAGVQVGYLLGGFLHWEAENLQVERGT